MLVAIGVGSVVFRLTFTNVINRISARLSIYINNDIQADIFDKIMNLSSTHDVMANVSVSDSNPTLRNNKYYSDYSDYSFYQDVDLIINSSDLNDEMELFKSKVLI